MFCTFPIPSSLKMILQRSLGTHISAHCIPARRKILFHSKSKQSTLPESIRFWQQKFALSSLISPASPLSRKYQSKNVLCVFGSIGSLVISLLPIWYLFLNEMVSLSVSLPLIVEKSMLFINTQKKTISRRTV